MAAVGGSSGFGAKPKALVCHICGREFGTKSLAIHIKACAKKWEDAEAQKPPRERRPVPQAPSLPVEVPVGATRADLDRRNEAAMAAFEEQGMVQCEHCGRTFLSERLPVHQRSCTAEHPARAVNKPGAQEEAKATLAATISVPRSPAKPQPKPAGSPAMSKSLKPGALTSSPAAPAKPGSTAGLAKFCPSCGTQYTGDDKFCSQCGTRRP